MCTLKSRANTPAGKRLTDNALLPNEGAITMANLHFSEPDVELVSQLLNRHADALPPRVLFVNPPDQLPASRQPPLLWSTDWLSARHWGAACHFGAEPPAALEVDLVVINWPKSHRLGHYQLAALAARVAPGTALWLVGEKRGGVATAAKQLSASPGPWQPPHKADAARHCLLFTSALQQHGPAVSLTPLAPFTIDSGKGALRLASFAGVFGEGGLDEGSALLLGCLNDLPEGPLVDVGCGCGVLGLSLAQRGHRQVTLCDVNAMALAASRYNASANGLQVEVVASDLLDDLPATPLAAIISNPPFHEGLNQTLAITERLVASSWLRLRPGGELRLVANRHLPYAELLAAQFGHFDVLAENNRFKVYRMVRGR